MRRQAYKIKSVMEILSAAIAAAFPWFIYGVERRISGSSGDSPNRPVIFWNSIRPQKRL